MEHILNSESKHYFTLLYLAVTDWYKCTKQVKYILWQYKKNYLQVNLKQNFPIMIYLLLSNEMLL